MGNGIICTTTPKTWVVQGGANYAQKGAAPPPPPKGAVGGGVALHLSAVVVVQAASKMVPMPLNLSGGSTGGVSLYFTHTARLCL